MRGNASGASDDGAAVALERNATEEFGQLTTEAEIHEALKRPSKNAEEEKARRRAALRRLGSAELRHDIEHALEPFAHLLERNPRSMKRLLNAYGVERALQVQTGVAASEEVRIQNVRWIILRLRQPTLPNHLIHHPEHAELFLGADAADDVPVDLRPLAGEPDLRNVLVGQGFDVRLDAAAVSRFGGAPVTASITGT